MRYLKILTCSLLSLSAGVTLADSFDDAVTLYLKGFEHCSNAKSALTDNQLDKALKAFAEYRSTTEQAAKIDPSIMSTSQRGMDSNLKYCNRVGTDIELAQGTPLLEQSLSHCDLAFDALKQGNAESAQQSYQQYIQGRDNALSVAPSLTSVFSLKSEIRRCDRLESKISNAGKQQAELVVLLDAAREESEAFNGTCTAGLKELQGAGLNAQAVQTAEKALSKVEQYKRNANDSYSQYLGKQAGPDKARDAQVDQQMKAGAQCVGSFSALLATQKSQLVRQTGELKQSAKQLDGANQQCSEIGGLAKQGPDAARYEQGKSRFEAARKTRDSIKRGLTANTYYQANTDSADVRDLNQQMDKLNRCLESARGQVADLVPPPPAPAKVAPALVAVPAPVEKVAPAAKAPPVAKVPDAVPAPEAKKAVAPQKVASAPAASLQATLKLSGLTPEFVLVYWVDGSHAPADKDAEIFPTGFGKKVYILPEDGHMQLKNADFGSHSISLVNPLQGIDQTLANIGSRQNRSATFKMPDNSVAMMRSNRERVEPSFVVSGVSNSHQLLKFSDDGKPLDIELANPTGARQLAILMPDTDPLVVEVAGGDDNSFTLTRNKVAVGSLSVRGL